MNKFEKQLEKWNNGVLRGAQAKLAKKLCVSTATVALWTTGKRHPSKGYMAKMAQLFKLDMYEVTRLFAPSTPYAEHYSSLSTSSLQDADTTVFHHTTGWLTGTSVSLPVLTRLTSSFPHYTPADVQEWWILPQAAAQDTSYLFSLSTPTDPDQILFIKPCSRWVKDKWMLAHNGTEYILVQSVKKGTFLAWPGKHLAKPPLEPLGLVLRRLAKLN